MQADKISLKEEILKITEKECQSCQSCPLWESRTNAVFGSGNTNAKLMLIGEAPGANEDSAGLPFVGASGKKLNSFLEEAGIKREDVYIANILKCRPPKNRDPKPQEENACISYLFRQIEAIKPDAIVCLGRVAAKRLIKKDYQITEEHGLWYSLGEGYSEGDGSIPLPPDSICGIPVTAIFHPSAVIYDKTKAAAVIEDLKNIKEKLLYVL